MPAQPQVPLLALLLIAACAASPLEIRGGREVVSAPRVRKAPQLLRLGKSSSDARRHARGYAGDSLPDHDPKQKQGRASIHEARKKAPPLADRLSSIRSHAMPKPVSAANASEVEHSDDDSDEDDAKEAPIAANAAINASTANAETSILNADTELKMIDALTAKALQGFDAFKEAAKKISSESAAAQMEIKTDFRSWLQRAVTSGCQEYMHRLKKDQSDDSDDEDDSGATDVPSDIKSAALDGEFEELVENIADAIDKVASELPGGAQFKRDAATRKFILKSAQLAFVERYGEKRSQAAEAKKLKDEQDAEEREKDEEQIHDRERRAVVTDQVEKARDEQSASERDANKKLGATSQQDADENEVNTAQTDPDHDDHNHDPDHDDHNHDDNKDHMQDQESEEKLDQDHDHNDGKDYDQSEKNNADAERNRNTPRSNDKRKPNMVKQRRSSTGVQLAPLLKHLDMSDRQRSAVTKRLPADSNNEESDRQRQTVEARIAKRVRMEDKELDRMRAEDAIFNKKASHWAQAAEDRPEDTSLPNDSFRR